MEHAALSAKQIRIRPLDYPLKILSIVIKVEDITIITKSIKFTGTYSGLHIPQKYFLQVQLNADLVRLR